MQLAQPETRHLKKHLADAARAIATRLATQGHQAWIVGGAVRDLALGLAVEEIDMATAAEPEVIEAAFETTIPVGKAFGTVIVVWEGLAVEVTTFRSEHGHSDGRRPDQVRFGATAEEDAKRRDFSCNALFLDPLSEEVLDPTGGLGDLAKGVLVAIGNPNLRFREDGLRLMRLARFHARLGLEINPQTLQAARQEAGSVQSVSPERVFKELVGMLSSRRAYVALGLLDELGILDSALVGWKQLTGGAGTLEKAAYRRRIDTLEWLKSAHAASGLAVLFDALGGDSKASMEVLERLKPSNALLGEVRCLWRLLDAIEQLWPMDESHPEAGSDRSARLVILGNPLWPRAREIAAAFGDARGTPRAGGAFESGHLGRMARELEVFGSGLTASQISPDPLLSSADLAELDSQPGPHWGRLLGQARELQLQAKLCDRAQAKRWLAKELSLEG